jgi:predicted DNA-binding helix-hairpin-helix protein
MTTQFVVGPAGETDYELLKTSEYLFKVLKLSRVYFMSFRPVNDTPLEQFTPSPPQREIRLYQASFLLRDYGYKFQDLYFDDSGDLPIRLDPKAAWAETNLIEHPVEINRASRHELLRIPGIGPRSVRAIIKCRQDSQINDIEDLKKIGVNPIRALPYILLNGRSPANQLRLFC